MAALLEYFFKGDCSIRDIRLVSYKLYISNVEIPKIFRNFSPVNYTVKVAQ